ncbi:hypothetical protein DPEC_G00323960 [Dallia pectoralis]|uniref:Uncharacterized protein n=1 Tax=Dallia pectoralis TaxID=75939 RepID=A0ACC2FAP0_DALPE|nr:hypothetical protein DPEC_G00323960 [Dallia pectoralis]
MCSGTLQIEAMDDVGQPAPCHSRHSAGCCLGWAGAMRSIILLHPRQSGCLINDSANNNRHTVTSVSAAQAARPGAALCRLPPPIRTPLEEMFTHTLA